MSDDGWTAWDSLKDWFFQTLYTKVGALLWTARGKAIAMSLVASAAAAVAHFSDIRHKQEIVLLCVGAVSACVLIFIWTSLQSRFAKSAKIDDEISLPAILVPVRAEETSLAFSIELISAVQTETKLVVDGYAGFVSAWNQFWTDLRNAHRKHGKSDEWPSIRNSIRVRRKAAVITALETFKRRIVVLLQRLQGEGSDAIDTSHNSNSIPLIAIQSPSGGRVPLFKIVTGFAYPSPALVQVLVEAGARDDKYWYPQFDAMISRYEWAARARFGDQNAVTGWVFRVCAVIPNSRITEQRIKEIPADAVVSEIITITLDRDLQDES